MGVLVVIEALVGPCPLCGADMHVQKTAVRGGVTLSLGRTRISETVRVCSADCEASGLRTSRRPLQIAAAFPLRGTFGYDVIVYVGLQRFVHHRQREEIRAALAAEGVDLSASEISVLCGRFVDYLVALHQERAPQLRAALDADGGWPMHIDATGEDGRGTLLVVFAGWRRWVLGAWKVSTERTELILPRLHQVADLFGDPCAVMRDLGRAVSEAAATFVAERELAIAVLACHMHFLRDIGKDLMRKAHDDLRDRFRHFGVLTKLRVLARDLGRQLGSNLASGRQGLVQWQGLTEQGHQLPDGHAGLAVVRALAQWILDHPSDGLDQGFPFDVPMLDLYDRCQDAARTADAWLRTPPHDALVHKACERLRSALDPVESEVPFEQLAKQLRARKHLFGRLRNALRMEPRPAAAASCKSPDIDADRLDQSKIAVDKLAAELRQERPERGPARDTRDAIDIVLAHLDRHGHSLWGHQRLLTDGRSRLVDRTNNVLEGFFHTLKHGERRRSGRKVLTQDLEHLPPGAAIALNLTHPDYVHALCGSLDLLPAAFADLDARGIKPAARSAREATEDTEMVSASLPAADKKLVRADGMFDRIRAAAASRAPRALRRPNSRAATVV